MTYKNKLLTVFLSSMIITTNSQSSVLANNSEQSAQQPNQNVQTKNLPKEDLIKKLFETNNEIKSVNSKIEQLITDSSNNANMNVTIDASSIKDPLSMKIGLNMQATLGQESTSEKFEMYYQDNFVYLNTTNPSNGEKIWLKSNEDDKIKQAQEIINATSPDNYTDLFKSNIDKVTVQENNGKYEITYNGSGSEFTELAKRLLGPTQSSDYENIKIEKVYIKYIVNKDNFFIENVESDMTIIDTSISSTMNAKTKASMFDHNQVKEITLPEAAKNAVTPDSIKQ